MDNFQVCTSIHAVSLNSFLENVHESDIEWMEDTKEYMYYGSKIAGNFSSGTILNNAWTDIWFCCNFAILSGIEKERSRKWEVPLQTNSWELYRSQSIYL